MVIFDFLYLKTKSDPNIHQNAPNCTILEKKLSGGTCPRIPLAERMASPFAAWHFATCKFPNLKKIILGPLPAKSWLHPWVCMM